MKTISMVVGIVVLSLVGCTPDPKSGKGFTLPDGDVERGRQTFANLNCQACHTVAGVTFDDAEPSPDHKIVRLGGETSKVQTYGDLVTSIINPSHRFAKGYDPADVGTDGQSKMRLYNDEMTVQQLIDLVTFLESHYSVVQFDPTPYGPFYY